MSFYLKSRMFQAEFAKVLLPPKTLWTKEEDKLLTSVVQQFGPRKWNFIAEHIPGRTGKQCRERWVSHISPELINIEWNASDDEQLINLHNSLGNKWAKIAQFFPGRPPNAIKNRFNCLLRKKARDSRLSPCPSDSNEKINSKDTTHNEDVSIASFFELEAANDFGQIDCESLFDSSVFSIEF